MRPILTPGEAAALDRATQARGVAASTLMERAGEAVARAAVDVAGGAYGRRAVVICGKGNNGGDGLVAARHLARRGLRVAVLLVGEPEGLREPAAPNVARLQEVDVGVRRFSARVAAKEFARANVIVDAVFGTGFHGKPEGEFAEAIRAMNASPGPVVAVDIPSGVNGATGAVDGDATWAELTVTFGAEKLGTLLVPGAEHAGLIEVADIGFPDDLIAGDLSLLEEIDAVHLLPVRELDAHKRSSGVVLVVGGSRLMTGAPTLAGRAAARTGAGLVTVAGPASALDAVRGRLEEATFALLAETDEGTISPRSAKVLADLVERVDAIALGPGIGRNPETASFVRSFASSCPAPMVLDADGLNAFEGRAEEIATRTADTVLTPHAGEFARLTGVSSGALADDRVGHVRKLAAATGATVLLKGGPTIIVAPGGEARITDTGTTALATGGSGDVLTGTIAALLARGLAPFDAAAVGAFVHGVAGRLAGATSGEGATAGDVLEKLPEARHAIMTGSGRALPGRGISRWVIPE